MLLCCHQSAPTRHCCCLVRETRVRRTDGQLIDFGKQEEVNAINVDLDTKIISVSFNEGQNLDDDTITNLITDSGYNVESISRVE